MTDSQLKRDEIELAFFASEGRGWNEVANTTHT